MGSIAGIAREEFFAEVITMSDVQFKTFLLGIPKAKGLSYIRLCHSNSENIVKNSPLYIANFNM